MDCLVNANKRGPTATASLPNLPKQSNSEFGTKQSGYIYIYIFLLHTALNSGIGIQARVLTENDGCLQRKHCVHSEILKTPKSLYPFELIDAIDTQESIKIFWRSNPGQ
jgi:hypothetical protein